MSSAKVTSPYVDGLEIIENVNNSYVPSKATNAMTYIAVHYRGCLGDSCGISTAGYGGHYDVYKSGAVYHGVDDDKVIWHVGASSGYTYKHSTARNKNTIGIEMSVGGCDGDVNVADHGKWWFTEATQEACAMLVAHLMHKHGIPLANVLRHGDITTKCCPAPYIADNGYKGSWTWAQFKKRVQEYYNGSAKQTTTTTTTSSTSSSAASYSTTTTGCPFCASFNDTMNIRKGPGTSYSVTGKYCTPGVKYGITALSGTWGKLESGAGWVNCSSKYCTRTPKYYLKYEGVSSSIVEALTAVGEKDVSKAHRAKIALANGTVKTESDFTGSALQNTQLLVLLKQGKLIKA